mgnify:CR=1 FL=1
MRALALLAALFPVPLYGQVKVHEYAVPAGHRVHDVWADPAPDGGASILNSLLLWGKLDSLKDDLNAELSFGTYVVGTATAITTISSGRPSRRPDKIATLIQQRRMSQHNTRVPCT